MTSDVIGLFNAMWRRIISLWSSPRVLLRRVLALDDTPHAVALGAAVGMLFGLTPTVGLQTLEVILFAVVTRRLFYFNRAAALILIYVSNPLTVAPIYYGLYTVGSLFVPGQATLEQFQQILSFEGFTGWWQALSGLATDVGLPLAIGTLFVAPAGAAVTYPITRMLLSWYRGDEPPQSGNSVEHHDAILEMAKSTRPALMESAHPGILQPQHRADQNRRILHAGFAD
jgi:uncharacterized protein (DUF2062 family)